MSAATPETARLKQSAQQQDKFQEDGNTTTSVTTKSATVGKDVSPHAENSRNGHGEPHPKSEDVIKQGRIELGHNDSNGKEEEEDPEVSNMFGGEERREDADEKAQPLPQEVEEGNIEYKLKLINPSPDRLEHLVSQLKWRLVEGNGEAIYEIGVEDDGVPTGLTEDELRQSMETLEKMAKQLNADVSVIRTREGVSGKVAEMLVRKYASEEFFEVRVAVVGNVDSGKSTLLGVLTRGQLDNGRGLARTNVFVHKHEIETGRTSSISHEILGFDSKGKIVNYAGVRPLTITEISEQSAKMVNFIDLAGHEKYLKTTVFGLTGHAPDFAMLMVGANMGVSGMTKEHLGIALALKVPVFIVVTKIDMCPENILRETMEQLKKVLKSPGCRKIPIVIKNDDDVVVAARNLVSERIAPIFCVSNVTGENLELLRKFFNLLPARTDWEQLYEKPTEFHIDATWSVPGVGTVVSGTLVSGKIGVNQTFLLGPDEFGKFIPANVKSIHTKRLPVKLVKAGQTAAVALKKIERKSLRKGMVIVDASLKPFSCREFEAEVLVLYHSTTISTNYQAVIHCGVAQQTAKIIAIDKEYIRTGDKAKIRFRFMYWPEYLKEGSRLIFREGRTKGIGRVTRMIPKEEELGDIPIPNRKAKKRQEQEAAAGNRSDEEDGTTTATNGTSNGTSNSNNNNNNAPAAPHAMTATTPVNKDAKKEEKPHKESVTITAKDGKKEPEKPKATTGARKT